MLLEIEVIINAHICKTAASVYGIADAVPSNEHEVDAVFVDFEYKLNGIDRKVHDAGHGKSRIARRSLEQRGVSKRK